MQTSILITLQAAFLILTGLVLKKKCILDTHTQKGLSALLLTVLTPASVLQSALDEVSKPALSDLLLSAGLITGYYLLSILIGRILAKPLFPELSLRKIFVNLCSFANVGFIGFAMILALYGPCVTIHVVLYNLIYQVFLVVYAIPQLSRGQKLSLADQFRDPLNISCILAVILFFFPVHIPSLLTGFLSPLSGMVLPVSMIVIGCQLSDVSLRELLRSRLGLYSSLMRLVLFPLLMLLVCRLLKVETTLACTLIVLTGLPCGSLNAILAEQYDCAPKEAAIAVVESTLFMIFSLPLLTMLLGSLL